MKRNEAQRSEDRCQRPEVGDQAAVLVNRPGLAVALGVSLRTVDRMLAAGEIAPLRLRGWTVRFYVPDVVSALNANAGVRKHGRKGGVATENAESTEGRRASARLSVDHASLRPALRDAVAGQVVEC